MRLLRLSNCQETKLDDEDFEFLSRWKWKQHPHGYACRTSWDSSEKKWLCLLVHRIVTGAMKGQEVHHINGDKLDNRKCNLKIISPLDHRLMHVEPLVNSAKMRQVYPDKKNCVECGKSFEVNRRKRKRHKCCSHECAQKMRVKGVLKHHERKRRMIMAQEQI